MGAMVLDRTDRVRGEQVREQWEATYRERWREGLTRLQGIPGVVLGFHSVIDGLKRVKKADVERALERVPVYGVAREAAEGDGATPAGSPEEIRSPRDFLLCLLDSMQKGKAMQRMIRDAGTFRWLMEEFGYDFPRLGGTSGNMSSALAPIGVGILVYANPLTTDLAELFVPAENLRVLVEENGAYALKTPRAAASRTGVEAIHWIFEYPEGLTVRVGEKSFATPRANRFIASWNPVNNQLRIDPAFRRGLLARADEFSHFIVSGFHILSETYPDGTTYKECLIPVAEYLAKLRRANPEMLVHYEFASIGSARIRRGIVDWILPRVDSLGLNEVELITVARDAGEPALAERLEKSESIVDVLEATYLVASRSGLRRIQLHNLGYYLCLTSPGYAEGSGADTGMDAALSALLAAATLAAYRTAQGAVSGDFAELGSGLAQPLSSRGLAALRELDEYVGAQGELEKTGVFRYREYDLAFIPTKVVAEPVLTVGLGDLISATAFLATK